MEKIWNRNFTLLASSNFLICLTYYSLVSVLPLYLNSSFHAGKSMVGVVMASFMIACVLIRPFAGFALDRYGRKKIFIAALFIHTVLIIAYMLVSNVLPLTILRVLHGLTWGITSISGSIVVADNLPAGKRGQGFGYYGISTTMAMAVGPLTGSFIFSHLGHLAFFWSILIMSFASFICGALVNYQKLQIKEKVHFAWRKLFDKNSIGVSLNITIIMSTYGGLLSFIALYGKEIGIENTSWFFLVFALGIGTSRFGIGKVFDKNGPKKILSICLLLLIVGFLYLAIFKSNFVYYSSGILLGYGIGAVFPTFQAIINNMAATERRGAANSTLYTALDLGMGAGMVFTGFVSEHFSISTAFLCCAVIISAGLFYFRKKTIVFYENHKII